jgi:hypothetical protein
MNSINVCVNSVNNVYHGVERGNRATCDEKRKAKRSSARESETDLSFELIINSIIEKATSV